MFTNESVTSVDDCDFYGLVNLLKSHSYKAKSRACDRGRRIGRCGGGASLPAQKRPMLLGLDTEVTPYKHKGCIDVESRFALAGGKLIKATCGHDGVCSERAWRNKSSKQ